MVTSNLDWLPTMKGGSRFGFHFLSDYQSCPTKWYNRNLRPHPSGGLGIEPLGYRAALDIGSRVHRGLEAWYLTKLNNATSLDAAITGHRSPADEFPDGELAESISLTDRLLRLYHERYLDDPAKEIVWHHGKPGVELELQVDVGYKGYLFTARLDLVWRFDSYVWAVEHKTVAASLLGRLLDRSDIDGQFTGQYWLLTEHFPGEHVGGVVLDAIVKDRGKSEKPALYRKNTSRTPEQIEKFRLDVARRLDQIENAVGNYRELLDHGLPHDDAARVVFDGTPDPYQCVSSYGKCEFYDLCLNRRVAPDVIQSSFKPRQYLHTHENPFQVELDTTTEVNNVTTTG